MKLEPCPRCHSENVVFSGGGGIAQIICKGTSLDACGIALVRSTAGEAAEAWNWRAPVVSVPMADAFGVHQAAPAVKRRK